MYDFGDISYERVNIYVSDMAKVFNSINLKKVPESIPNDIQFNVPVEHPEYSNILRYRSKYITEVGFVRVSSNWIRPLSRWIGNRKCLEIMAGSGALTFALKEQGVKIKATDDFSWSKPFRPWIQVENIDCISAIEKYGKEVSFIICSWPYMDDTAYRALLKMREVNPKCRMIYIGEGSCGCTADDNFFNSVIEDEVKGFYESVRGFSSWKGIHDYPCLYK